MRKIAAIAAVLFWSPLAFARDRAITVASTTSTEQSRPVRLLAAAVLESRGHQREGRCRRHRPGAGHRGGAAMPTWCSSMTGPPKTSSCPKGRA